LASTADRLLSRYAREALTLLGQTIRLVRLERRIRAGDLADRAAISRGLLHRIEKGDPSCAIGSVFEVAAVLGLPLMEPEAQDLGSRIEASRRTMALLPRAIRNAPLAAVDDDF